MPDSYQTISIEPSFAAPVVVITLQRPEVLNAINSQLAKAMVDCLAHLRATTTVRVVIVTGAGEKAFWVEAKQIAQTIAANASMSVRNIKQVVNQGSDMDMKAAFNLERELYERNLHTEDRSEGILAVNEKRKPLFRGC